MTLHKNDLIDGFEALGLKEKDVVLVHSSLSSFGYVEGGADTVINALLETTGLDGAVMVPTLTGKSTDSRETPPVFDVRTTPCWTGRIPETFRKLPEAKRSLHPTHSVAAIGAVTDTLIKDHAKGNSPCDQFSPYYKNGLADGYIMLIGVDQESNTTVHCCEELANVPYHLQKETAEITIKGYSGEEILVKNRLHDWEKPPTDFNKFDSLFIEKGIMKIMKIGNSEVRLINAGAMIEFSVNLLKKDPYFLLEEKK